ncbi:MAG TPA: hypothetical protein VEC57_05295 [Candidatus Limnocylindrales bacterium]|nr:hypothetical protein [Candidatus Limnocylindrales bacterium]
MTNRHYLRSALGAAVFVALASAPAAAALDDGAVDCRADVAKAYSKLVSTAAKTIGGCHKSRNADKIPSSVDCNDVSSNGADSKGKIAGAAAKLEETVLGSCSGETELLDYDIYSTCPAPCDDLGLPNPMGTIAHVADCLACLGPELVAEASAATLDNPAAPMASKDDQKCHATIAKAYPKYVATLLKGRHACQGDQDAEENNDLDECDDADPDDKGAAALVKAEEAIVKACTAANLSNVGSCATTNLDDLSTCLAAEYDALALSAFTTAYELPTTLCPTGVRSTIRAGSSIDGPTDSTLSVGWSGLGHEIDIVDNYTVSSNATCPGSEAGSCGDCTINGISLTDPGSLYYARCTENVQISCSNPFGTDAACPGAQNCGYYLGPPLPVSAGGTPTCTMNRLATNVTGTANPDNGTSELNLDLRAVVHLGGSGTQPCPVCEGDVTAQDGLKNGTCTGGPAGVNGDPCDVQGFDLSFAKPEHFDAVAGVSLDCPPSSGQNFSGSGLIIDLNLTTGTAQLPFEDNCDGVASGELCACGVCSGDGATPCRTDAACSGLGLGVCTNGAGPDRNPNGCTGYVCETGTALDRGTCANPIEMYCDGFTRANGRGVISCEDDEDCAPENVSCPGAGCGTCNLPQLKSCFLDPIQVQGTPSTTNPVLAGTFCLPPTSNTGINSAAGSPGPGAVKVDMLVDLLYD